MQGYRYISEFGPEPKVGDRLPNSKVWDENCEPTAEELPGTCAWRTLGRCREYARSSKGWIVLIDGDAEEMDPDFQDAILIGRAEVVEVMRHTTS